MSYIKGFLDAVSRFVVTMKALVLNGIVCMIKWRTEENRRLEKKSDELLFNRRLASAKRQDHSAFEKTPGAANWE